MRLVAPAVDVQLVIVSLVHMSPALELHSTQQLYMLLAAIFKAKMHLCVTTPATAAYLLICR